MHTKSDNKLTRTEIYSKLWNAVNTIQTNLSDWEFKSYIFSFIFYKHISERQSKFIDTETTLLEALGQKKLLALRKKFVDYHGYWIHLSATFEETRTKINSDKCWDAHETLNDAFELIAISSRHKNFKGLLDVIIEDNKELETDSLAEKNAAIRKLMNAVADMNIDFSDDNYDFIGDIYEYLIGIKERNSRQTAGQYYTPQEIAKLLTLFGTTISKPVETVYDPTCGTGSLLLQAHRHFTGATLNGQEINATSSKLCRMNMIMKEVGIDKFNIKKGCTLTNDLFKDKKFDLIVANPPFSLKWQGGNSEDPRFNGLVAPSSFADWAFNQHILYHLADEGVAAVTCFPGALYRGRKEAEIRKWFIENNYIDAVIKLTDNLFYGTSIGAAVIVLRKNKENEDILFIDASQIREKRPIRNKLNDEHIHKIFSLYEDRQDVEGLSKVVSNEEVLQEADFSLEASNWVRTEEKEEPYDAVEEAKEIAKRWNDILNKFNAIDAIVREMDPKLKEVPALEEVAEDWLKSDERIKAKERATRPMKNIESYKANSE